MATTVQIKGEEVVGEVALEIEPGAKAEAINTQLDRALGGALAEVAATVGAVVATQPSKFAKPLPGKDERGRVRYAVLGRFEGDRLVPAHGGGLRRGRG